jgi:galactokinase
MSISGGHRKPLENVPVRIARKTINLYAEGISRQRTIVEIESQIVNPSNLAQEFERAFSQEPVIYRAPGRVNLIGEHTDYNDGFVMPAAIAFSAYVAIAPRDDRKLSIQSDEYEGKYEFSLDNLPVTRAGLWCDYVLGVASILTSKGCKLKGANLLIHSEVPVGAGLSSSAAIEVASALALLGLTGQQIPLPEIATICRRAENEFVGARVGIMDQFISCMGKAGHALLLDCRSLEFKYASIPRGLQIVVCNTMVKHELASNGYNTRRDECEQGVRFFAKLDPSIRALRDVAVETLSAHAKGLPAVVFNRCSHVIYENQRTLDAAQALQEANLGRVCELMLESHRSLRDLYEVSCEELDIMVECAQDLPGFCGGRMTGGGFGGCTVNLVREENAPQFKEVIAERYQQKTGITPQIYLCTAENGAARLN